MDAAKVEAICGHFEALIGSRIVRYQTAELQLVDGTWTSWPDLPIRIFTNSGSMVSISWSDVDDLWLSNDDSLPFNLEDATTRWVDNSIPKINDSIGRTIHSVMLGRGNMTVEDREIEIWTRLLIDLGDRWLEIFNALDENGYDLHNRFPTGEFTRCI